MKVLKNIVAFVFAAIGIAFVVSVIFFSQETNIYLDKFQITNPVLYPLIGALGCGIPAYWTYHDIKTGEKPRESFYIYRVVVLGGASLVFAGMLVYEIGKAF